MEAFSILEFWETPMNRGMFHKSKAAVSKSDTLEQPYINYGYWIIALFLFPNRQIPRGELFFSPQTPERGGVCPGSEGLFRRSPEGGLGCGVL
jgi:hypothetical protein